MNKPKETRFSNLLPLNKMVRPALRTIIRGTKISKDGIHLMGHFNNGFIEKDKLNKFNEFIGFRHEKPLAYLYLMAQRAQAAVMLQKDYSLSIPGTVHLSNSLKLFEDYKIDEPFDIKATVIVKYKETGSLTPQFTVEIYQNDMMIAECKSGYLVKRKNRSGAKTKREQPVAISNYDFKKELQFDKGLGTAYANVSDDHNPIHKSAIGARLAGFKSPIMQGWYLISKSIALIESEQNSIITSIENNFYSPVYLPSKSNLLVFENEFQLVHEESDKLQLTCNFSS